MEGIDATESASHHNTMALCASSKVLEVKREVDVTEESPQLASHSDRVDFSESTAVSKVKVETDDVAETDSCCDPRELPKVKVESDIAAASVPSVSGCDRMDCYKSDPAHTSEVNIEIDVAEEIPQSWTVQDPMQSKLSAALHIHSGLENLKSHFHQKAKIECFIFYRLNQREFPPLS